MSTLERLIRNVPDFPKPGIIFKDITPLLADPAAMRETVDALIAPFADRRVDTVVGVESRGFIFGSLVADRLNAGFVPVRKPGKLPAETFSETYELEYGTDSVEIHTDAIAEGAHVLMIDDLLATGGTMAAACRLVEKLGAKVSGVAFVIELDFLHGRDRLDGYEIHSLIRVADE